MKYILFSMYKNMIKNYMNQYFDFDIIYCDYDDYRNTRSDAGFIPTQSELFGGFIGTQSDLDLLLKDFKFKNAKP